MTKTRSNNRITVANRRRKLRMLRIVAPTAHSLKDILLALRLDAPTQVLKLAREEGIQLPVDINLMVQEGATLPELRTAMGGITKQGAFDYLKRTGQYELWVQSKEKRRTELEEKRTVLRSIVLDLSARIDLLLPGEDWAVQKAAECDRSTINRRSIPFGSLVKVFQGWKEAKDRGETVSYKELGEYAGTSTMFAYRVITESGVDLDSRKCERIGYETRRAIRRAFRLEISGRDIAYFLDISESATSKMLAEIGTRPHYYIEIPVSGNKKTNYKEISQILEAIDLGFEENLEICEALGLDNLVVKYVRMHEEKLRVKLTDILKILFPDREISKPYKSAIVGENSG